MMGSRAPRRSVDLLRRAGGAVLLAALAACGGGGGGSAGTGTIGGGLASSLDGPGGSADASGLGTAGSPASAPAAAQLRPGDFTLNTTTAGDQGRAAVAALPGGGFAAVWSTSNEGASDVRLRRFAPDGQPLGPEQVVAAQGRSPGVTAMADGGFLVSWSASPYMYEANGWVQRFDAQGAPVGGAVQVAASYFKYVARPLGLPDGSYVLTVDTTTGRYGVEHGLVARYGADGTPLGTPVQLTSQLTPQTGALDPNRADSTIAARWPDGRFAVAWIASGTGVSEVRVSRFDTQGNLLGTEPVARDAALQQPALAVLSGGQLALAWVSEAQGVRSLWLEVFGADGLSQGRQALATGIDASLVVPRLAALDDGGFVLGWKATRYDASAMHRVVNVQRFGAAGQALGPAEQLATISVPLEATASDMDSLDVMAGAGGSFLVVHGDYTGAGGWDVRASVR